MRKRQLLARVLYRMGINSIGLYLRSRLVKELPVLVYHRILDVEHTFPFDAELVDASLDDFRWQMQYVKKNFNPITFGQLKSFLQNQIPLPSRPIIVSFDDGFDDNYHNAFPILKETGVPATVFLTTGHIGTRQTFWYDWLAYLILNTSADHFSVDILSFRRQLPKAVHNRGDVLSECVEAMKRLPNTQRLAVLDELELRYGSEYTGANERIKRLSKPLTWAQCREMCEAGIEFGSHSVSHPILTSLTLEDLRYELAESKRVIEEKLDQEVIALAFPNGRAMDFDEKVVGLAKELGYWFCGSYMGGINKLSSIEQGVLDRITPEPRNDKYIFSTSLVWGGF